MSSRQFIFHKKYNNGFTLVELIVVILIIGILSVSIAPRFFGVSSYEDRKTVDDLLTTLRYTQQMAMNRGGNIRFILTSNNYTVELTDGTQLRSPDGLKHSSCNAIPFCYKKDLDVASATTATIVYDRLGKPSSGLTISIGSKQIRIEQETGYAHQL